MTAQRRMSRRLPTISLPLLSPHVVQLGRGSSNAKGDVLAIS